MPSEGLDLDGRDDVDLSEEDGSRRSDGALSSDEDDFSLAESDTSAEDEPID